MSDEDTMEFHSQFASGTRGHRFLQCSYERQIPRLHRCFLGQARFPGRNIFHVIQLFTTLTKLFMPANEVFAIWKISSSFRYRRRSFSLVFTYWTGKWLYDPWGSKARVLKQTFSFRKLKMYISWRGIWWFNSCMHSNVTMFFAYEWKGIQLEALIMLNVRLCLKWKGGGMGEGGSGEEGERGARGAWMQLYMTKGRRKVDRCI